MFFMSQLQHKLRLPPHKLDIPLEDGLIDELQSIFLDKVIPKLGLCVSVCNIKSIDGGFVLPNDGAPTYTVVFRMIMFRPYVGEIISGKLKESDSNGIRLTLGFFDDIYVHKDCLPYPSHFRSEQKKWDWIFDDSELTIEGDEIRFQVVKVDYPTIPLNQEEGSKPFAPMVVTGFLNQEGLGPVECEQKKWDWIFDDSELTIEGDEIRFQVVKVDYPTIPLNQEEGSKPFAPMVVTGFLNQEGLGPVEWWV